MGARTHYFRSARRAPIILGVLVEHPFSRRARAPTIRRGTSTHCLKNSQTENNWADAKWTWKKWVHENALLKKWGRALIIFGGSTSTHLFEGSTSTHLFEGSSTHYSKSNQLENRWMNTFEYKKESQKNKFMKYSHWKMGARAHYFRSARRAPIILGVLVEHPFLRGREHPLFQGGTSALNNVALLEYSFVHK